jgi:hypothetical protein
MTIGAAILLLGMIFLFFQSKPFRRFVLVGIALAIVIIVGLGFEIHREKEQDLAERCSVPYRPPGPNDPPGLELQNWDGCDEWKARHH